MLNGHFWQGPMQPLCDVAFYPASSDAVPKELSAKLNQSVRGLYSAAFFNMSCAFEDVSGFDFGNLFATEDRKHLLFKKGVDFLAIAGAVCLYAWRTIHGQRLQKSFLFRWLHWL